LIDLGIRPQILAPAINITIAQRLVRKLCPNCKKSRKVLPEELEKIKKVLDPIKDRFDLPEFNSSLKIHAPGQCTNCHSIGYLDRIGVFEAFVVSKNIERLILTSPPISAIEEMAISEGMTTITQDAYLKILDGSTTIEEVERVI